MDVCQENEHAAIVLNLIHKHYKTCEVNIFYFFFQDFWRYEQENNWIKTEPSTEILKLANDGN